MDYDQLREILVNTENIYRLWQSTGLSEEEFIRANGSLIEESEKARLAKEAAKARQTKYLEKQKEEGRRHLTALVSSKTYDRLCRLRDQAIQAGEKKNLGQILDELLSKPEPTREETPEPVVLPEPTRKKPTEKPLDLFPQPEEPTQDVPERETPEYSDYLFNIIDPMRKAGFSSLKIEKKLNDDGIKPYMKKNPKWKRNAAASFHDGRLKKTGLKWDSKSKTAVPLDK